ncbi:MAG: hypothetical protein AB7F41_04860 [Methylocystis sp.]|uniref:hypothetical protein n=1 Tax=Methylocystis sp. TaxID=1911079 RepID=UPI003D0C185E
MTSYAPDLLRQIMRAYIRNDNDDPAMKQWRQENPDVLPEDDEGFLPVALATLGEFGYRRELLPFVAMLDDFADATEKRDDYPHGVDALRTAIRKFEHWLQADVGRPSDEIRDLLKLLWGPGNKLLFDGDANDQFFACLDPSFEGVEFSRFILVGPFAPPFGLSDAEREKWRRANLDRIEGADFVFARLGGFDQLCDFRDLDGDAQRVASEIMRAGELGIPVFACEHNLKVSDRRLFCMLDRFMTSWRPTATIGGGFDEAITTWRNRKAPNQKRAA